MDFTKYNTPQITKDMLLHIMEQIHSILTSNNIKYFIDGGSLLGAVRHQGIIPWDDDIDIGILIKDFQKLIPLFQKNLSNEKYNIQIENTNEFMIKVYIPNCWYKNVEHGFVVGTPTIDFFKYTKCGDVVKLASMKERQRFKNCYYKKDELYPLKEYKFNNIVVLGANKPNGYLFRYYGNDCLTNYKVDIRKDDNYQLKDRNKITN